MGTIRTQHRWTIASFGVITLLILGPMLLPGYVLTLDMAWPEHLAFVWNSDGFNNALPLSAVLALLGAILPSWVVQKVVLLGLFFALLYLPYRFLPFIEGNQGRIFAGLVYALNPFVYSRMLAGQWTVLFGYALLPLVLSALARVIERRDTASAYKLAGALLAVGTVSIHFLYLSVVLSIAWIGTYIIRDILKKTSHAGLLLAHSLCVTLCLFGVVSLYWVIPALTRTTPIEARFDLSHFDGFAASENHLIPTLLNLAVLGGFWGEGMAWRYYFTWPQDTILFWCSAFALLMLVTYGGYLLLNNTRTRMFGLLVLCTGFGSYVLALGVWGGVWSAFNSWWYTHMPGWSGLRDSHKIAGVLMLMYALCAGVAIDHISKHLVRARAVIIPLCFIIPVFFGIYEWNGFHKQLTPVWYPESWYQARSLFSGDPAGQMVLTLPWRGYYSLTFTNQRIIANLTPSFFGVERVRTGRSVEVGSVYDQEVDSEYRSLDTLIRNAVKTPAHELQTLYARHQIRYLLVVRNPSADDPWLAPPYTDKTETPNDATLLQALLQVPHKKILEREDLVVYELMYE